MNGKIRYVLKENTKYEKALPSMVDNVKRLNNNIEDQEQQVKRYKLMLSNETRKLREVLQEREQILTMLKDLKVIKRMKKKNITNGNPSEIVSLNNPTIEIFFKEEELKVVEEREQRREKERKEEMRKQALKKKERDALLNKLLKNKR